jgi:hypothetical protein
MEGFQEAEGCIRSKHANLFRGDPLGDQTAHHFFANRAKNVGSGPDIEFLIVGENADSG